jgi:hypothetical protein
VPKITPYKKKAHARIKSDADEPFKFNASVVSA